MVKFQSMICYHGVIRSFLFLSLLCSATLVLSLLLVWPMYVTSQFLHFSLLTTFLFEPNCNGSFWALMTFPNYLFTLKNANFDLIILVMFLNLSVNFEIKGITNQYLYPSSLVLFKFCFFVLFLNKLFSLM